MRPLPGVGLEIGALAAWFALWPLVPPGPPFAIYFLIAQLLSTYLLHCPAHYVVGVSLGIRFRDISVTKSTLARSLPVRLRFVARLFYVPTISTVRSSVASSTPQRVSAMYASGTAASVLSAFVLAAYVTLTGPLLTAGLAWAIALGYAAFDAVFSPRSGDLRRARSALKRV